MSFDEFAEYGRQIAREAKKDAGVGDHPDIEPLLDARRGRSVRIEIPLSPIHIYRQCLYETLREVIAQLEDSNPRNMKGRSPDLVLGFYQDTWRRHVAAWKKRV